MATQLCSLRWRLFGWAGGMVLGAASLAGMTLSSEEFLLGEPEAPVIWGRVFDGGWARFPGGVRAGIHSVDGTPMVFSLQEGDQVHQPLALLPGRIYMEGNLELMAATRILWGDNLLWGGGGDLFYNGARVRTEDGPMGIGTNQPTADLDVRGSARITGDLEVSGVLRVLPGGGIPMGRFTRGPVPVPASCGKGDVGR